MAATAENKLLNIVSGGHNPIRDYVTAVLEAARTGPVRLRAKLKAIPKAISVAEVAMRCAADHGFRGTSKVELLGMREEGVNRRGAIQMEIWLQFQPAEENAQG